MMERMFLAFVGVAYLVLAAWCAIRPEQTSQAVGFTLTRGSGQSEFLTVYGGLQTALGLAFLIPLIRSSDAPALLWLCLMIHGVLVLFRTISFGVYSGMPTTTYILAGTEWIIFLGAAVIVVLQNRK